MGSRPPVCFAKYAEVPATLPEVAGTAVTQRYLLHHTPALSGIQWHPRPFRNRSALPNDDDFRHPGSQGTLIKSGLKARRVELLKDRLSLRRRRPSASAGGKRPSASAGGDGLQAVRSCPEKPRGFSR